MRDMTFLYSCKRKGSVRCRKPRFKTRLGSQGWWPLACNDVEGEAVPIGRLRHSWQGRHLTQHRHAVAAKVEHPQPRAYGGDVLRKGRPGISCAV